MPEGRSFPWKYLPRRGVALSVTFGEPISAENLKRALASSIISSSISPSGVEVKLTGTVPDKSSSANASVPKQELSVYSTAEEAAHRQRTNEGWLRDITASKAVTHTEHGMREETARLRSTITALLQREVEKLGKRVLGRT